MAWKHATVSSSARVRAISKSIASARAVMERCEARLYTSRLQVLRAEAVVRSVRIYLEAYDEPCDVAAHPLSADNGTPRAR